MAKFLHILRRTGKLEDVRSVFTACEAFSPLSVREAGYNYCKGLYFWSVVIRQYHNLYYNWCNCMFLERIRMRHMFLKNELIGKRVILTEKCYISPQNKNIYIFKIQSEN